MADMDDIRAYNRAQATVQQAICDRLAAELAAALPDAESRIWHGAPVWFLAGNPVAGYSVRKSGAVQLLFWSGQSFEEPGLKPEGKFKAAAVQFTQAGGIDSAALARWLTKARSLQWDYANIVRRGGRLEPLSPGLS